jgi:uncharacterized protein (DUF608 family)
MKALWIMLGGLSALSVTAGAQTPQKPAETVQQAQLPGFKTPVWGRWIGPKDSRSGVPLGGLGTGFLELRPDGRFYDAVLQNNWLAPRPPAACALTLAAGPRRRSRTATLLASAASPTTQRPNDPITRYFGHFPMADLDYARPADAPAAVSLRACAPFVPGSEEHSNIPAALFRIRVRNEGMTRLPVALRFWWANDIGAASSAGGNVDGFWGWKRARLAPGRSWVISVAHVLSNSDAGVTQAVAEARRAADLPDLAALERECTEAGGLLRSKSLEITLDEWGGFNWEFFKQETGVFGGVPTVGQILYALRWNGKTASLDFVSGGPAKPNGLIQVRPLRRDTRRQTAFGVVETADRTLRVTLCCRLTGNVLLRWFVVQNLTQQPVNDAGFAYYANPDIGGPGEEADDMAAWKKLPGSAQALLFSDSKHKTRHALVPLTAPTHAGVGTWGVTQERMQAGDWTPVAELESPSGGHAAFQAGHFDGALMRGGGTQGSYALSASGEGWTVRAAPDLAPLNGLSRAQVEARTTLGPGEERAVTFVFAWHFPSWRSSDNRVALNRYAARFMDAEAVAQYALANAPAIEREIVAWQEKIYARDLPGWLKDGLVNGLYSLARNTVWLDDGRFFHSESFTGCPITETLVCRFNGSFPLLLLFPEQEKQTMRSFAKMQAESGQVAFGFGSPCGLASPMLGLQKPIVSSEFVLMCWRDYLWTGDREFLRAIYPAAKRAMQFAMTLDTDGDGLINDAPGSASGFPANQYYDIWPWHGHSAYVAGIGLAALRAAEQLAAHNGDTEFAAWCRERFAKGQKAFEEDLWNGRHYRLWCDPDNFRQSDTSLTNQLCGQWYAWLCDLGDLHPLDHIASALRAVGALNVPATEWGAVSGVRPSGLPDESGTSQSQEVVVGEVWNYATTALMAARRLDDPKLRETALQAAERAYRALLHSGTLWNQHFNYSAKDGSPVWGSHYYSDMCLWAMPFGYDGKAMKPGSDDGVSTQAQSGESVVRRGTPLPRPRARRGNPRGGD